MENEEIRRKYPNIWRVTLELSKFGDRSWLAAETLLAMLERNRLTENKEDAT